MANADVELLAAEHLAMLRNLRAGQPVAVDPDVAIRLAAGLRGGGLSPELIAFRIALGAAGGGFLTGEERLERRTAEYVEMLRQLRVSAAGGAGPAAVELTAGSDPLEQEAGGVPGYTRGRLARRDGAGSGAVRRGVGAASDPGGAGYGGAGR